jgi:hypothetical protein
MSDLNIRFVLHRLWKTWRASGYEKDRPQSYVFMLRPSPIDQTVLEQWGIRVLSEPDCKPEEALESFLETLATTVDEPGERETKPLTSLRARPRREPRKRARAGSSAPGS